MRVRSDRCAVMDVAKLRDKSKWNGREAGRLERSPMYAKLMDIDDGCGWTCYGCISVEQTKTCRMACRLNCVCTV